MASVQEIYQHRFGAEEANRGRVWDVLVSRWFQRYVLPTDGVLDLGCGWGHFINRVNAQHKFGLDLNPASRSRLDPSVTFYEQRADSAWPLADDSLDVVFTSNFFEHLPNREGISSDLSEAHRALRPGGTIVCLGPNIRFTGGAYWDFFDHHVPLTDRSLGEAL